MMRSELETTLGESVSEDLFQLLQAVYNSDAAPALGGEQGRLYLKSYLKKNRTQLEAMASILKSARAAETAQMARTRDAERAYVRREREAIELREAKDAAESQVAALLDQKRELVNQMRGMELDVRIATDERDRLKAAMGALEETLTLMGLDVDKVARLAQGIAVRQSVVGECEGALNSQQRFSSEVASTLYSGLTEHKRALAQWQAQARQAAEQKEVERTMGLVVQTA